MRCSMNVAITGVIRVEADEPGGFGLSAGRAQDAAGGGDIQHGGGAGGEGAGQGAGDALGVSGGVPPGSVWAPAEHGVLDRSGPADRPVRAYGEVIHG